MFTMLLKFKIFMNWEEFLRDWEKFLRTSRFWTKMTKSKDLLAAVKEWESRKRVFKNVEKEL